MNRKLLIALVFLLSIAAGSLINTEPAAAAKNYFAERYDVNVAVQSDGSLIVTETITFRFEGGPFTYVFRGLKFNELDQIDRLQAGMDGQELPQGTQAGQVEIAVGKPLKITWHFAPTSDAVHEFKLVYRVQGAIYQDADADVLVWRAIPEDHEYTISRCTIHLEYPPSIAPIITPTLEGYTIKSEETGNGIAFMLSDLGSDTLVKITARFPSGSLINQPPDWQSQQASSAARSKAVAPFGFGAAIVAGIASLAALIGLGQRLRRDGTASSVISRPVNTPPNHIPPALAVRLTGSGMGFLGTLFDLARRGVLTIEEGPKKWGSRTFEVNRQPTRQALRPHENIFLEALFAKVKGESVPLSDIASLAYNGQYSRAVEEEIIDLGWIDAERKSQRGRFLALSALGLLLGCCLILGGILLFTVSPETSEPSGVLGALLLGAGGGLASVNLIGVLVGALISTLSDEGVRQAAAWNSFTGYLRQITQGKEQSVSVDIFDAYLSYAAAFGIATEWAKYFQKLTGVPVPEWFKGLQSSVDDGSFIAIMAAISSADSSASVSAGGDGGGGSGGGSSGAG